MSEPNAAAQFHNRIELANEAIDRRALGRMVADAARKPLHDPRDLDDELEHGELYDTANEI